MIYLIMCVYSILLTVEGDILGAMAQAVEESDVILMCMSERYRDSKSCRSGMYGKVVSFAQ